MKKAIDESVMASPQGGQPDAHHGAGTCPPGPAVGTARVWLVAGLCAAAVYVPTMAPGVLWGDSGEAHLRVLTGALCDYREIARSHVTYYAVAIALHKALHLDAALAANLLAALAGAITVANFACLVSLVVRERVALACGVALLLFSHTLWQLSTGAEVVTFFTMCLSLELVLALRFLQTGRLRWLVLAAFVNGLGWSTHNFAMLMWPAYLVTAVLHRKLIPRPRGRSLAIAVGAWVVGCMPLIVLVVLEYQRLGELGGTARSLLVGIYDQQVFNTRIGGGLLVRLAAYLVLNFPTPLLLLAVWGWVRLRRDPPVTGPGGWLLLTIAALAYAGFAGRYNVADQYTFLVPAYLFLILFVSVGAEAWLGRYGSRRMKIVVLVLSLTGPLAYAVAPPLARRYAANTLPLPQRRIPYREPYNWFLRPWRTGYRGPERYAREVLASLPPNAVLLTDSTIRRPLDYLQGDEGLRLDARLPNTGSPRPWQEQMHVDWTNGETFIDQGLLFCTSIVPEYIPSWLLEGPYRFEAHGHVYEVQRERSRPQAGLD